MGMAEQGNKYFGARKWWWHSHDIYVLWWLWYYDIWNFYESQIYYFLYSHMEVGQQRVYKGNEDDI